MSENTTENEYLEMAAQCKEIVERKDQVINFYKSRLSDIEDELRCMAYLLSNMIYLSKYKLDRETQTCKKNIDKSFFEILERDHFKLKHFVDTLRDMTDVSEEDEEIGILVNM